MNGTGSGIDAILRRFKKEALAFLRPTAPLMSRADLDWCLWSCSLYPATLKGLTAHKDFDSRKMADAYLCGYSRGLRDAVYELTKRSATKS
jgi:hypothetical protein